MINTNIRNFYFSCPNCEIQGKAREIHYVGGINDCGGFVLKCKNCNKKFFLQIKNPFTNSESVIYGNDFEIEEILDFEYEDDRKKANILDKASNLIVINGEEEIPFLKDAWKVKPQFNINENDKIFICSNCKNNVEKLIFDNIEKNLSSINKIYKNCFNVYVKGRYCDPKYIIFQSEVRCNSCNNKIDYISYSKFNGRGEEYETNDFLLSDIKNFNPQINGIYTREESKRILEKLVIRWNLLASEIFIVSPFIGFSKSIEKNKQGGLNFIELMNWLLTILDESKTKLILRKTEYEKIKEILTPEMFDILDKYNLIHPLIKGGLHTPVQFHAKFYAGIIPKKDKCYVEILSGSYNLHDASKTKENLIFTTLDFSEFYKNYSQPLELESECKSLSNFEILKIINGSYKLLKIKTKEDLWGI